LTSTEGKQPATTLHSGNRARGLVIAIGALGVAAAVAYFLLDPIAPDFFRAHTRSWAGTSWPRAFRQLGKVWAPIWLLFLYVWATGKRRLLIAGLLALVLSASVTFVKVAVQRPRPDQVIAGNSEDLPFYDKTSFPSGDTASAFAIATAASVFLPLAWQVLLFAGAASIGILRLMSVRHFPSDVFAGAAFGILCGLLATFLVSKLAGRAPPGKWRCSRLLFAAVLFLPGVELLTGDHTLLTFIKGFGPLVACTLLVAKGEAWLRWLRFKACSEDRRVNASPSRSSGPSYKWARWAVVILIGVVALATLPALSRTTLFDRDEGYYAESAREMLVRGDPFVPHFSGQPWLEKPPLTYWLMALSMCVFGETEFAARLPSALAGLLAMWLTFQLARRMFSPLAGVMAAAVLGTSAFFSGTMRFALLDNVLVCCLLLSMIGVWKLLNDENGAYMFWTGIGLGVLAKGALGFALPVIALVGVLLWTGRWHLFRRMRPMRGILLVLAIVGVWAIPANWLTGGEYFHEAVWRRTIRPVFVPLQGHGGRNFLEYLALLPAYVPILLVGFLPWSLLAVQAARGMANEGRRGDRVGLIAGWLFAQLAVLSLVRTKLPHHVMPLIPPVAVAVGAFLADAVTQRPVPRRLWGPWGRAALVAGSLAFAVAIVAAPVIMGFPQAWPWFLPTAIAAVAGASWTAILSARRNPARAVMAMLVTVLFIFSLLWQQGLPYLDRAKAPLQIARVLQDRYTEDEFPSLRLGVLKFNQPSLVFYLKRPISKLSGAEELDRFLTGPGTAAVILPRRALDDFLTQGIAPSLQVIWEKAVWVEGRWREMVIISNDHPPEEPPRNSGERPPISRDAFSAP